MAIVYAEPVRFTPTQVGRYIVGKDRTPEKCPLVVYPALDETAVFKRINLALQEKLEGMGKEQGFSYKFIPELQPENYLPHITLFSQPLLRTYDLVEKKDQTIKRLNSHLEDLSTIYIRGH